MSKKKHRNNNYNGQRRITGKDLQVQTTKIKGKFYDRESDGNWRMMLDTDADGVDTAKLDTFFTSVQEPTAQ